MEKAKKRAFTILELVIVIFVVSVLAAVFIPTFSKVIKQSQIKADMQLVRNLNTAISIDADLYGKHKTMYSALEAVDKYGYDIAKIKAGADGREILWDSVNDVFCYYDEDSPEPNHIEYIPQIALKVAASDMKEYQYWKIYSKDENIPSAQTYSVYLADEHARDVPTYFSVGVDVGNNADIDIHYIGAGDAQSVIIRTNGGTLTVDAHKDTVWIITDFQTSQTFATFHRAVITKTALSVV